VNPDVDGNSKTLNTGKYSENAENNNNLLKPKIILKSKFKLSGGPAFTLACEGGRFVPLPPVSYTTAKKHA